MGYLSRAQSIGVGYVTGGLVTLAALPALALLRGLGESADRIISGKGGVRTTCSASGMADISQLGSTSAAGADADRG